MTQSVLVSSDIEIGHHPTFSIGSFTFNSDTVTSTIIAGLIVIGLGLMLRRSASAETPGKMQLAWEALVDWVTTEVEANLGKLNPFVIPLAVTLFVFILISNWVEVVPTEHKVPPATADTNLTYALGLIVIIAVQIYAVRERGLGDYAKGFLEPYPVMAPLTILEELIKPFTLALRLFGNIFAGGIMLLIIGLLPAYLTPLPTVPWKLFGMAIGVIQAFIFALLTILYFGMAAQGHGGGHDEAPAKEHDPELQPA